ncbi:MAG: hypothetical protein LUQ65_01350 [Candidatus Helarchaeota archaeon]|nr:hypothetical protein [Candidatus Helarchaeota archaeon]
MGGFRTVFGGFLCIIAGLIAFVFGLYTPSALGLPTNNWLCGFLIHRWTDAIAMTATDPTFGYLWLLGLIMWTLSTFLLIIGGFVGFWRGGGAGLAGAILFFIFELIVNIAATNITAYGSDAFAGLFHLIALAIFLIGLIGGILQASAERKR